MFILYGSIVGIQYKNNKYIACALCGVYVNWKNVNKRLKVNNSSHCYVLFAQRFYKTTNQLKIF